ncbi:ESCRT III complex subunit vps24 [Linderina macrospora]|uniref:ESCRT III complex subunit vps24 n=1 Tax=Linderina macrospora TaxID=4868 RepID=A0ACC1J974_9FUNG|nr:ESCRT III complex subunit vps24 [Linderina macrospora]
MKSVNSLIRVPQLQMTLMEMSKEMMKAGIIEEMTEDALESLDDPEVEEEAEEEVENILAEVTEGVLGKVKSEVPKNGALVIETGDELRQEEEELDLDDMRARLSALRS